MRYFVRFIFGIPIEGENQHAAYHKAKKLIAANPSIVIRSVGYASGAFSRKPLWRQFLFGP